LRKSGSFSKIEIIIDYLNPKTMPIFTNLNHQCPHIWIMAAPEQEMLAAAGTAPPAALERPG